MSNSNDTPVDEIVSDVHGNHPNKGKTNLCTRCGGDPAIATGSAAIGTPGCICGLNIGVGLRSMIFGVDAPRAAEPAVPWRDGVPSDAVIRAHMQQHPGSGVIAAHFQVREYDLPPAIVHACESRGAIVWGYVIPVPKGAARMPGAPIVPGDNWQFRPIDITTGDPRAWIDPTEGA